jgi:hypothetical protein
MKSTRYYNQHAEALSEQYRALEAEAVHRSWVAAHLPVKPGFACDIGAAGEGISNIVRVAETFRRAGYHAAPR